MFCLYFFEKIRQLLFQKREIMVPAKKPFIGPMNKQFERAEEIERERTVETDTEPMEVEY